MKDNRRYVAELVWLPTYISIAIFFLLKIDNSNIAAVSMLLGLIGARMVLELIYRLVFGRQRLLIMTGVIAFTRQVVVWGSIWLYLAGMMS